jgi:RNA polymerase sigma-70 factor, ECF subfamily
VRRAEARRRRDTVHAARSGSTPYDETATAAVGSVEAQVVRSALATLSPAQRRALELAYFDGYTHQQVSGLMSAPLGTTKSRIRDGLIRLRDALPTLSAEPA